MRMLIPVFGGRLIRLPFDCFGRTYVIASAPVYRSRRRLPRRGLGQGLSKRRPFRRVDRKRHRRRARQHEGGGETTRGDAQAPVLREMGEGDAESRWSRLDAADRQKIERHGEAAAQGLGQGFFQAPQPGQPLGLRASEMVGKEAPLGRRGLARQQCDVGRPDPFQIDPHRAGLGIGHGDGDRASMGQADAEIFGTGAGENRLLQHAGSDRQGPRVEIGPERGERAFGGVAPDQQAVAAAGVEAVGEERLLVAVKEAGAMSVEPTERRARQRQGGLQRPGPGRVEPETQAAHQRPVGPRSCRAFGAFLTRHAHPPRPHQPGRKRAIFAMRKPGLFVLALSGLLCGSAPTAADDGASARIAEAVERAYRPLLKAYEVPGLAVAVTRDGRSAVFTFGLADRDGQRPVTRDTLFEIGSVSKTFTATLAAYAQGLGRLSLEDAPSRFLPVLRGSALDRVSLLELGTYTAGGLPLQFPDSVTDAAAMTAYFRYWQPSAPPGTERRYSNPSLGLFGAAAAAALGGDFSESMRTRLFPELGLKNSFVRVPEAAMGRYAWGYGEGERPIRVNPGVLDAEAYGVKSSAADMIRFVEANIDPTRLDPPMRRAVEGTHVGYFRVGAMVQGLGWEQYPYPVSLERLQAGNAPAMTLEAQPAARLDPPQAPSGPTLFNKTGSTNGFGAYVAFVPERRIGLVMLANRAVPIAARIAAAHAVLEALAAEGP